MSLLDHIGDVAFASRYPIDKIVEESELLTETLVAGTAVDPTIVSVEHGHTAGELTAVTGMFSIDGTNFYPFGSYFDGDWVGGQSQFAQIDAYNDATTVTIKIINAFQADTTFTYFYVMESVA